MFEIVFNRSNSVYHRIPNIGVNSQTFKRKMIRKLIEKYEIMAAKMLTANINIIEEAGQKTLDNEYSLLYVLYCQDRCHKQCLRYQNMEGKLKSIKMGHLLILCV
jgi:hypothetical protein